MNKLFTTMKSNVGSNIQDTSSAMAIIIGRYINDTYYDFLRRINHEIYDYDYSFDTVAGQKDYVLPSNFKKELYVIDNTNKNELSRMNLQLLADAYVDNLDDSGVASRYVILRAKVKAQPTSSSVLAIVSSNTNDTTQTIYIRGISSGVELTESVTLNGTSSQNSTNSYTEIISISKSSTTIGKVTITSNSGVVEIAVIPPQILNYSCILIRLNPNPSGVVTIKCPYIIEPQPLTSDHDVLLIDADDIIEQGTTAMALRYKRQYAKAQEWERLYEKSISNFIWNNINQPNQVYQMNVKTYSRDTV